MSQKWVVSFCDKKLFQAVSYDKAVKKAKKFMDECNHIHNWKFSKMYNAWESTATLSLLTIDRLD